MNHFGISSAAIMAIALSASTVFGQALFTENFDTAMPEIGRNRQFETGLTIKHAVGYPSWTKQGVMPAHFVLQSKGDWALMLFSHKVNDNIFTLERSFAANKKGTTYAILLDVGPGVYAMPSQVTKEGDSINVELLRDDDSVLKRFSIAMRGWDGDDIYSSRMLTYQGDGTGNLRFRLSPGGNAGRFYGAIDKLQVFASVDEAKKNLAKREALENERIAKLEPAVREKRTFRARMNKVFGSLGDKPQKIAKMVLAANKEIVFDDIKGNTLALECEIDPQEARWVQLSLLRSPKAQEVTTIRFYNFDRRISIWYATQSQLVLDTTYSSQSPDASIHPPQQATLPRRGIEAPGQGQAPAEPLKLRVLVEGNVVSVLANNQLFLTARVGPLRADSIGVSLRACGQDAKLHSFKAWQLKTQKKK